MSTATKSECVTEWITMPDTHDSRTREERNTEQFKTTGGWLRFGPEASLTAKEDRVEGALQWKIPSYSADNIFWDAPSSFVIKPDGTWALFVSRIFNGFDSYGPFDRRFNVRFWWVAQYKDASGAVVYQQQYLAGAEGYKGATNNVYQTGHDAGYAHWHKLVSDRTTVGWIQFERYY
jgi:hypothetical protein